MIFKRFFAPKWQHPEPKVRLAALESLDREQDAQILKNLASHDKHTEVRQQALNKLNDLVLWWQTLESESKSELRHVASRQVRKAVLEGDPALSEDIKTRFIERHADDRTLEKLALEDPSHALRVTLLKRLANPALIETAFRRGDDAVQQQLLELVTAHKLAKSLLKHAKPGVKPALEKHLEDVRNAEQMPAKVAGEVRLVLALFNALREKSGFQEMDAEFRELNARWHAIELSWLDEEERVQAQHKHVLLSEKLNNRLAVVKSQHEAQLAEREKAQREALQLANLDALSDEISEALRIDLDSAQLQQDWLQAKVMQAQEALAQTGVTGAAFNERKKRLSTLFEQVDVLPALSEQVSLFNARLAAIETIAPVESAADYDVAMDAFNAWHKDIKAQLRVLPGHLQKKARKKVGASCDRWLQSGQSILATQERLEKNAVRKIRDIKRLIDNGRFNAAIGVFKGLEKELQRLSEQQRISLERDYRQLEEQLNKLIDLQSYAAAPKRKELLQEALACLDTKDSDPVDTASRVKALRARWNELGKAVNEQEIAQASEFDAVLEQLFAPCRDYYASIEAEQQNAKQVRVAIIAELVQLSESAEPESEAEWRTLEGEFKRLNKRWRNSGQVGAKDHRVLQGQFRSAAKEIKVRLDAYYNANAAAKKALVDTAKSVQTSEDVEKACAELLGLQKQWRGLGFAGYKQDKSLWRDFRAVNDDVFARRSNHKQALAEQQAAITDDQRDLLADMRSQFDSSTGDESTLGALRTRLTQTDFEPALRSQVKTLLADIEQAQNTLSTAKRTESYQQLIGQLAAGDVPDAQWQATGQSGLSREQLLLRMEIVADKASPDCEQAARMAEQVAMLDEKMHGETASFDALLRQLVSRFIAEPASEKECLRLKHLLLD